MLTPRDWFHQMYVSQGYRLEVVPLPCEPHEWQWYYWKLYWEGNRVNGGICFNPDDGWRHGSNYAAQHDVSMHYENDFWDEETSRWMPKSALS